MPTKPAAKTSAQKATKTAAPRGTKKTAPKEPRAALLAAAKELIAERGWSGLAVARIARHAGLSVAAAYRVAPGRQELLDALADEADANAVEAISAEPQEEFWRDRLFDALMTRFDVLLPDRDVWRVIVHDERRDLAALGPGLRRGVRAMERLLEATHLGGEGPVLRARAAALAALHRRTFRVWLKDKDDQAKTMADLDRRLRRLERFFERVRPLAERIGIAGDARADEAEPSADGTLH